MKRILTIAVLALLSVWLALPAQAANCTAATVTNASSTVLAANTTSYPRRSLTLYAGGGCPVWCNIGGTAVEGAGMFVNPGAKGVGYPATQQSANTWPQVPNGVVKCILPTSNTCANSTTVSACTD